MHGSATAQAPGPFVPSPPRADSTAPSHPPSSSDRTSDAQITPGPPRLDINPKGHFRLEQGRILHLQDGISLTYQGATLSADRLDGDINRELTFSGHARIVRDGIHADADAIHLYTSDGRYRLENPRGVIDPSLLEGRVYDPVFLDGGSLMGDQSGYGIAEQFVTTTCREHFHHYELHVGSAELIPHVRLILRRVDVYLFGAKLITLPTLVVPLDQRPERRPRTDYLPEFGQNYDEGYFARFPYTFAEGGDAGTFVRADLTQKRGFGYRVEQEYLAGKQPSRFDTSGYGYGGGLSQGDNGAFSGAYGYGTLGSRLPRLGTGINPQNGGLFSVQGYLADGFQRNFNAAFRHQQSIGGSNRVALNTELQRNSDFVSSGNGSSTTTLSNRFDLVHDDATHGVNDALNVTLNNTNQTGSSSSQFSGSLKQAYQFGISGSTRNILSTGVDLTHQLNTFGATSTSVTRSALLASQFELQHIAREFTLDLNANHSTPIGVQTGGTNFGTLEKLPELTASVNTYSFRGGWLHALPATFQLGVGEYSEPSSKVNTNRVLLGLNFQQFNLLRGNTEVVAAGGMEQRFYGDGAANYLLHDTVALRQHLGGRSGVDLNYRYDQPEGGTPFLFDQFQHSHSLSVEGGYLNDTRFQFTGRTGYDFLGNSLSPWQYVSTRLMWHPVPGFRFDATQTYDPNSGRFFSFSNQFRIRGPNDLAIDVAALIDPKQPGIRRKFSQLNTQFDLPFGRNWRTSGLFRFNGLSGILESRNLQVVHEWDCLEASFTYTENVNSFRPDRQFYFAIRIKAFPFSRSFNRGAAGETIGSGINGIF